MHIYFIEAKELGLTRIGVAQNAAKWAQELDAVCPVSLTLAGFITMPTLDKARSIVRQLHKRFVSEQVKGDWYRVEGAIAKLAVETLLKTGQVKTREDAKAKRDAESVADETALFEQGKSEYHLGKSRREFPRVGPAYSTKYYRAKDAWQTGWDEAQALKHPQTERVTLLSVSK